MVSAIVYWLNVWHADRTGKRFFHIEGWWRGVIVGFIVGLSTMHTELRYVSLLLMLDGCTGSGNLGDLCVHPFGRRPAGSYTLKAEWGPAYSQSMAISLAALVFSTVLSVGISQSLERGNLRLDKEDTLKIDATRVEEAGRLQRITFEQAMKRRRGFPLTTKSWTDSHNNSLTKLSTTSTSLTSSPAPSSPAPPYLEHPSLPAHPCQLGEKARGRSEDVYPVDIPQRVYRRPDRATQSNTSFTATCYTSDPFLDSLNGVHMISLTGTYIFTHDPAVLYASLVCFSRFIPFIVDCYMQLRCQKEPRDILKIDSLPVELKGSARWAISLAKSARQLELSNAPAADVRDILGIASSLQHTVLCNGLFDLGNLVRLPVYLPDEHAVDWWETNLRILGPRRVLYVRSGFRVAAMLRVMSVGVGVELYCKFTEEEMRVYHALLCQRGL